MPKDQKYLHIDIAVLDDPAAVPTNDDYSRHLTSNTMRFSLQFSEEDSGKIGYIRSQWATRTGILGPFSDPFRFNIL